MVMKEEAEFDVDAFVKAWEANAREGRDNACKAAGWNQGVAERTENAHKALLFRIVLELATTRESDDPAVARCQKAARFVRYGRTS